MMRAGSDLFEEITRLPEYYPTRTETAILVTHAAEMADGVPDGSVLVEFGSGSSLKTEILLDKLPRLGAYIAIDVSESALRDAKQRLLARFPMLDVRPLVGDFSFPVALPADLAGRHKTGFFPGSTIGNLTPAGAQRLLRVFRSLLSPGGRLIVGVDLKKDARKLVLAYNDSAGVTAAFNLNLLARINREIGGSIRSRGFPARGHLQSARRAHRDASGQPARPGLGGSRPPLPVPHRRDHPHRELLQILGPPIPRRGPRRRLDAGARVDGPRQSLQRPRAGDALGSYRGLSPVSRDPWAPE